MTAELIETAFSIYTQEGEKQITVSAEFHPGHEPARDNYGRPTECGSDPEFVIMEVFVDGIEHGNELDDEFARQFWFYSWTRMVHVRHTWKTFEDRCIEELTNEL